MKLLATERQDVVVKETDGGGLKFEINSGTYELFNYATDMY